MGPHCGLVSEKILGLKVTLKAVVFKTPGQTNSGALCLLQDFLRGASLRRRGVPWWRILTKRAAIAAMGPHRAVFCHRSIVADCCPAQFADEFRRRAFSASPVSQSVRWLFRSIGPESRTPSYSLLSARADAFPTPCAIQCRLSILQGVLVVFFLVAFVLRRNKKPVKVENRNWGQTYWPSLSRPGRL